MTQSPKQIFISHAHADRPIIDGLKRRLETTFGHDVKIFATVAEDSIQPGQDWFETIRKTIQITDVALFVLTPRSIQRNWVWLEMGSFWEAHAENRLWMVPLLVGLTPEQVLPPINRLQATTLTDPESLKAFWKKLKKHIAVGDTKNIQFKSLSNELSVANAALVKADQQRSETARFKTDVVRALRSLVESGKLGLADLSLFEELELITGEERRSIKRPPR
jgi:hypothetical protein